MIIGLAGKIGSGKTTVAEWLKKNEGFEIASFGAPVRDEISSCLALHETLDTDSLGTKKFNAEEFKDCLHRRKFEIFEDLKNTDQKHKYRGLMQWWGTDYRRAQDANYWVKKMEPWIRAAVDNEIRMVIDDVRFSNEIDLVNRYKGRVFCVVGADDIPSPHVSENSLNNTMMHGFIGNSRRDEVGLAMLNFTLIDWADSNFENGWWGP